MSLAIANARDQYVLLRNFTTGKWENIAGDGKTCRVQVTKKSPDHILRIIPEVEGGQKRELKLSKENRVHFSKAAGFIQVPVANSKELYGIKFKDAVEGEVFYTKLIKAIGVPCSYYQTMIGADGNPDPVSEKPAAAKPFAQSLPQSHAANKPANTTQSPKAQPSQPSVFATLGYQTPKSSAPQAIHRAWWAESTPYTVKEVKPDIRQQNIFNQQSPSSQPRGQYTPHHPSPQKQPIAAAALRSPHPNQVQQGSTDHRDVPVRVGTVAVSDSQRNQPAFVPSRIPHSTAHLDPVEPMHYVNIPFSESDSYSNQAAEPTANRANYDYSSQSGFSHQAKQPLAAQLTNQFQPQPPPPSRPTAMNEHSVKRKDYYDGPVAPSAVAKMSTSGSGSGASSAARQPLSQSQVSSSAAPRLQRSLKPSDMKSVAEAMSDAVNRCDERLAREKFEALMTFMKTSETGGKCEMNFSANPEPDPSQSTFTLNIQVEFQNPNKEPIPIFLDDVSPDNTISVLSARVEHHFYIPRLSQNWIIGSRLVKGTDMNKTLKDFDVRGGSGEGVSVFMYVMHTKKAQVPNEAAKVRQQHVQHRQQQQQELMQQPTQSLDAERPPPHAPRNVWT